MMYVVSIAVDLDRAADWEAWMRDAHVPDVMATGCFVHATMVRDPDADTSDRRSYRVAYLAKGEAEFATYQREHAAALQADHTQRYDGAFAASRELLPVVARY